MSTFLTLYKIYDTNDSVPISHYDGLGLKRNTYQKYSRMVQNFYETLKMKSLNFIIYFLDLN